MADERDPKVSQRYRELADEEPSRELDQSILAAAHRAVGQPHAPLVTPSGRHRWYFSLGAAAVIVLSVAVTYHLQREQPDPDSVGVPPAPAAQQPPAPAAKPETASKPAPVITPDRKARAPERGRQPTREPAEAPSARSDSAGAAASRPEPAVEAQRPMESGRAAPEMRMQRDAAPAQSQAKPMQAPALDTPERMLERIAGLRKEGKHEEADRLLAEFKRRYPDYRLPENVVRP
jgi:hypothetical protein